MAPKHVPEGGTKERLTLIKKGSPREKAALVLFELNKSTEKSLNSYKNKSFAKSKVNYYNAGCV
jgi:hypothetical protein